MIKNYLLGMLFLLFTFHGFAQDCAAGFTLSSNTSSICPAGTAILTLSDSEMGVNYELRTGATVLNTLSGTEDALTFTVNPITTTTYTVTAVGCPTPYGSITITVNPAPSLTLTSANAIQNGCQNAAISNIAYSVNNATGAAVSGLPTGITGNFLGGVFTISGTPTVAGTFNYTVTTSGGCAPAATAIGTIMVSTPATAIISYTGSPFCKSLGTAPSATLSGTGAYTGGTYSAAPAGLSINAATGSITPGTSTAGTYTITYTIPANGGCPATPVTTTVTIVNDPVGGAVSLSNSSIINSRTECFTASGTLYLSGSVGNVVKWQYSTTAGTSWVDIANTISNYTYSNITQSTVFRAVIQNGGCTSISNGCVISVIPNIKPTPVIATPSTICAGESSVLSSTSYFATSQNIASGGTFNNSNPPGWTVDSCPSNCLSAGGSNTDPGPWQLSATNGGTYSGTTYTSVGKFAIANGNLDSQLYTATFDTFGLTTATLTFTHAHNLGAGGTATVEISANGGPWTGLATYTGSSGVPSYTNFIPMTINLNAYIGQPNLKIRFNYHGTTGSAWAVDNIAIPDAPPSLTTQWVDSVTGVAVTSSSTMTVSPTVTTTYAVTSYLNGCNSFGTDGTAYVTVTVNPRPTAVISQNQTVCKGATATFSIALTGNGPWKLTYTNGSGSTTVNNINTNPYVFNVTNMLVNTTYSITALNDSKCTAQASDFAGSATVTVLNGTAGLWTGLISTDWFDCKNWAGGLPTATINAQIPTGATRMPVIDPLSPFAAAYSYIATARDVIISPSASITMNANSNLQVKRDWKNSGSFIPGTGTVTFNGATSNQVQLINSGIKLNEGFYNLTLNCTGGAKGINLPDAFALTVANNLVLTSGDLRLTGEAQLVQNGTTANPAGGTGSLICDQQGTKSSYHYNYWSSPVSPDNLNYTIGGIMRDGTNSLASPFSPGTITFGDGYNFSDGALTSPIKISKRWLYKYTLVSTSYYSWQAIENTGSLKVGEGYTMKGVTGSEPNTNYQNYTFIGKPNNGNINLTMAPNQSYLLGNPYPSALNADEFIKDNILDGGRAASNVFNGALYFWDHFGAQTHILGQYVGGYAVYNLMGGVVGASSDPLINNNNASGSKVPKRYIPVAQGFFIRTDIGGATGMPNPIAGGTVRFKNSQRAFKTKSAANSIFFRDENPTVDSDTDTRQKIRLLFDAPSGLHRQLLVGADENTTNLFDIGYDAPMVDMNQDDMYWDFSGGKFVIQGIRDFDVAQIIPIGVTITNRGLTKIKIDELENIPTTTEIYLFDNLTGIYHNLRNEDFQTELAAGEYLNRFSLRFTVETLGTDEAVLNNGIMVFADSNHILHIKNNIVDIRAESVQLYTILGQSIATWDVADEEQQNIKIPVEHIRTGTYIVKVKTANGSLTKKIIIR